MLVDATPQPPGHRPASHPEQDVGLGGADPSLVVDGTRSLEDTLRAVAEWALRTFAAGAGAVVRVAGEQDVTAAAGDPVAEQADRLHETLGEGPALDALHAGDVVVCGSLGGSLTWRRFGPRAGRMGLHSVLAVPLLLPGTPVGTVTVYAAGKEVFTEQDVQLALRHAASVATVVHVAYLLDQRQRTIDQLTEALEVRPVIDRAVGIIMSRSGKSVDAAFETLRRMSTNRRIRVADLAEQIVEEAVRRARRRQIRRAN